MTSKVLTKDYFTSPQHREQNFKVQWSYFQWSIIEEQVMNKEYLKVKKFTLLTVVAVEHH
jgi:hypothetical protein